MEISPVGTADDSGHRTIVVALDTELESLRALDWVQDNFHKPGDVVHLVHVCKCMSPPLEVFHGNILTRTASYLSQDVGRSTFAVF